MRNLQQYSLIVLLPLLVNCNTDSPAHIVPLWQKLCVVVGIMVIIIAAVVYVTRNKNINVRQIIRGYVVPASEVTFVNFKNENEPGVEAVVDAGSNQEKSTSFDDDNNYLSRDQELSIDQGSESDKRNLAQVFQQKEGSKQKKSKSRKRLANVARVSNNNQQESAEVTPESDL